MDFKLNVPGNYTPQQVQENDFLNSKNSPQDLAKFGKTYSVQFEGNAETYLWTAKSEPEVGKSYYGHFQETSGKMLRFKVDKQADGSYSTGPAQDKSSDLSYEPSTNTRWAIGMAYRAYVQVMGNPEGSDGNFPFREVKQHASELLKMFSELKTSGTEQNPSAKESPESLPSTPGSAAGYEKAKMTREQMNYEGDPSEIPFTG